MPGNGGNTQPKISELAAQVVKDDKDLRDELKNLVRSIVRHQQYVMAFGTPAEKSSLVKAILPQMLSAMGSAAQAEEAAAEQAAYDRMRATLRGELPPQELPASLRVAS